MRIRDNPVPARAEAPSRKRIGNPSLWAICLSWKANLHACMRVSARGCESGHACVSGWGWGGRPGPHPSTASLPAASPSRLLWQMFVCAMATPEQDVPLDCSKEKPTLPPTLFPSPKACCKEEPLGSRLGTNGVCVGREAEMASSMGSVVGRGGGRRRKTHVCTAQPRPSSGSSRLLPSAHQRMLSTQRGKRSCHQQGWSAGGLRCLSHEYGGSSRREGFVPGHVLSTSSSK